MVESQDWDEWEDNQPEVINDNGNISVTSSVKVLSTEELKPALIEKIMIRWECSTYNLTQCLLWLDTLTGMKIE